MMMPYIHVPITQLLLYLSKNDCTFPLKQRTNRDTAIIPMVIKSASTLMFLKTAKTLQNKSSNPILLEICCLA